MIGMDRSAIQKVTVEVVETVSGSCPGENAKRQYQASVEIAPKPCTISPLETEDSEATNC